MASETTSPGPLTTTTIDPKPFFNVVFTIPRTSSHLLLQILNLPAQESIYRPSTNDGYFYLAPLVHRFRNNLPGKDVSGWTQQEKDGMKKAFQESGDAFVGFLKEAEAQGKGVFIKEHVNWMVEPVSETKFLHGVDLGEEEKERWITSVLDFTPHPRKDSGTDSITAETSAREDPNETALPATLLAQLKPTLLIRHPLLTFPSLLRTTIDCEGKWAANDSAPTQAWEMTYHWSRQLYRLYTTLSRAGFSEETTEPDVKFPIVIDADDLLKPTLMQKYARAVGLDEDLIRYEWEKASEDEVGRLGKNEQRMKSTILASSGIVEGKTSQGLVLEEEVEKWKEEFGDVLAERLEGLVRKTADDYQWLYERRLKV